MKVKYAGGLNQTVDGPNAAYEFMEFFTCIDPGGFKYVSLIKMMN